MFTIYISQDCVRCHEAMELLKYEGYIKIDVAFYKEARSTMAIRGLPLPQIMIDRHWIGGLYDLKDYLRRHEYDKKNLRS